MCSSRTRERGTQPADKERRKARSARSARHTGRETRAQFERRGTFDQASKWPSSAGSLVSIDLRRWMVPILDRRPFEHCRTACEQESSGVTEPTQKTTGEGRSSFTSCFCGVRTISSNSKPPACSASEPPPSPWSTDNSRSTLELLLMEERKRVGFWGKRIYPFFLL